MIFAMPEKCIFKFSLPNFVVLMSFFVLIKYILPGKASLSHHYVAIKFKQANRAPLF